MNSATQFPALDMAVYKDAILVAGADTLIATPADLRWSPSSRFVALRGIGVRTAEGAIAPHGTDVYRHRSSAPLPLDQIQGVIDSYGGRAFYGGVAGPQFGHLLTQSLGRLWAAEPDVPILFLNANPGFTQLPAYLGDLFRHLNLKNPVQLVTNHLRVAELIVAKDHCNLDRIPSVTGPFSAWLTAQRPDVALDENLSIYVSRSKLDPKLGQYLQETALESALKDQGYQIIYPETLSLSAQIDFYTRAKRLIFTDGSAIHLWSLFAHSDQLAAMVLRRKLHRKMVGWFTGLDQANPIFLDSRVADFSGQRNASWLGVALLDMDQLWRRLRRRGFHRSRKPYFTPRQTLQTWISGIEAGENPISTAPFAMDDVTRALLTRRPKVKSLLADVTPDAPTDHIPLPHPPTQ